MTWEQATTALLDHFIARWGALRPGVPVDVPNGQAISPATGEDAWVRVRFRSSFSERDTLGGQHRSQAGRMIVNTFTPLAKGDGEAQGLDRDLEVIVETAKSNGLTGAVHLGAPEPVGGQKDPDVRAWVSGRSIPFRFDHTPTP